VRRVNLGDLALETLVARLREGRGVRGKRLIRRAARTLRTSAGRIHNGDDAAALPDPDGGFTLLAAEGMVPAFVEREPWFAGFCAVMTNVSDIAAMGGRPRAIVDVLLASDDEAQTEAVLQGLAAGASLFGVPVVGGHTGRSAAGASLAAAVLGKAQRLITSFDARPGEVVLACVDLRGQFRGETNNFDAVSGRNPAAIRAQLELLPQLAEAGLVRAGKDISMAGLVGTLLMLVETSGCGARLDVGAVPVPECARPSPQRWLEAFPSFGYLLAVAPSDVAEVAARFHALGVAAAPVARLCEGHALELEYEGQRCCFWNLAREPLMGFAPADEEHHA
jgi:AIR synthase-related protein